MTASPGPRRQSYFFIAHFVASLAPEMARRSRNCISRGHDVIMYELGAC